MYYGEEQDLFQNNGSSLYEWVDQGVDFISEPFDNNSSFFEFAGSQFDRFNIPITQTLGEELFACVARNLSIVYGYDDPYMLFWGSSDVDKTSEWMEYSYEISECGVNSFSHEAEPQMLETYRYSPGQDEEFFNEYIQKPGLDALPYYISQTIEVTLGEYFPFGDWDTPYEWISKEAYSELLKLCSGVDHNGNPITDTEKVKGYYEIALWSAILWSMGPLGRSWRYDAIDTFRLCYDHGSCILYEGLLYTPDNYTRILRPPKSCHICNVHAWCVEFTQDGDVTRFICEGCLNGSFSRAGTGRCGTKRCSYVQCPNHPDHTLDKYGIYKHLRDHGQRRSLVGSNPRPSLIGQNSRKLLQ